MIKNKAGQSGQALLLIVLVMIVSLTVGLSVVSRSIVDLRTSSEEADSQKALAAAEAGLERALQQNSGAQIARELETGKVSFNTVITEVKGNERFFLNGGNPILQDDGGIVWFVNHNPEGVPLYPLSTDPIPPPSWTGTLNIYWGTASDPCTDSAIEVAVIIGPKDIPSLKRSTYDPCGSRNDSNNFDDPITAGSPYAVINQGVTYNLKYKASISIASGLVAKIIPIYASTQIAVDGSGANLPVQGFVINSTGTSKNPEGGSQVQRQIETFKSYEELATQYFNYGLFSP